MDRAWLGTTAGRRPIRDLSTAVQGPIGALPRTIPCTAATGTSHAGDETWEVSAESGGARETELHSRRLEDGRQPINDTRSEILELRQTLATRAARRGANRRRPGHLY